MRQHLFFEFTRSSRKQIMYLIYCNQIITYFSVKNYKQMFLNDLIKHAQTL